MAATLNWPFQSTLRGALTVAAVDVVVDAGPAPEGPGTAAAGEPVTGAGTTGADVAGAGRVLVSRSIKAFARRIRDS